MGYKITFLADLFVDWSEMFISILGANKGFAGNGTKMHNYIPGKSKHVKF